MMASFLVRTLLDSPEDDYIFYICGVDSDFKEVESLTLIFELKGELSNIEYSKFVFDGNEYVSSINVFSESCVLSISPSNNHYFSFSVHLSEIS